MAHLYKPQDRHSAQALSAGLPRIYETNRNSPISLNATTKTTPMMQSVYVLILRCGILQGVKTAAAELIKQLPQ